MAVAEIADVDSKAEVAGFFYALPSWLTCQFASECKRGLCLTLHHCFSHIPLRDPVCATHIPRQK